jgi:formylglycine-generating enzyme required for sulfatase activity
MPDYLSRDTIFALKKAIVDGGMAQLGVREDLLKGIHPGYVGLLPLRPSPLEQIWSDLDVMNGVSSLEDGQVPLRIWLSNAVDRLKSSGRPERTAFQSALDQVVPESERRLQALAAQELGPRPARITYKGKEYLYISAGPFTMGSRPKRAPDADEGAEEFGNELPQHQVHVEGYYIARTPVTNAEYQAFVVASGQPVPHGDDDWSRPFSWNAQAGTYPAGQGDYPVVLVSWRPAPTPPGWAAGSPPKPNGRKRRGATMGESGRGAVSGRRDAATRRNQGSRVPHRSGISRGAAIVHGA